MTIYDMSLPGLIVLIIVVSIVFTLVALFGKNTSNRRLGNRKKILNDLKADVILYSEAASRHYGSHSDDSTGEVLTKLPYYGEILQRHVIPGSMDPKKHDPIKNAAEYWGQITNILNEV